MDSDQLFEAIKKYLIDEFEVPEEKIHPEAHLFDDLELDSIDAVDMAAILEAEMNLEVDEEELKKIRTIKDVITFIVRSSTRE
jgi:acyl carrier protein